ncbi:serine peptidase, partial [Sinorhizobium meliloti]
MSTIKAPRPSLKTVLKTTTVAGLAAVLLTTGLPAEVAQSFAEAVRVQAPAVPSFANVVDAVSPAVVSVRVQARERVSDDESNFT